MFKCHYVKYQIQILFRTISEKDPNWMQKPVYTYNDILKKIVDGVNAANYTVV